MKIYVDADACPVKKEIERVATRNKIVVLLVSNGGLRPILHPFIQNIFVSADADAADKWIVDNGHANDLVITADIILADNCIKKGMLVLKPNGEELNQKNIGNSLSLRDFSSETTPFSQVMETEHKPSESILRLSKSSIKQRLLGIRTSALQELLKFFNFLLF